MKYFGTDGIRGEYGKFLTDELSYRAGAATAAAMGKGLYIIGCDTRLSCPALLREYSRGLSDMGCSVMSAGILPTPAISYLTIKYAAKCGVMISASHNPPEFNGIKIFAGSGIKLTETEEARIEHYIDNPLKSCGGGGLSENKLAAGEYAAHICGMFKDCDFKGVKVALDCANGAAGLVAPGIFKALGCSVTAIHCDISAGGRINEKCGALYPETVISCLTDGQTGLSFDGDADRLSIAVNGEVLDGDSVIYNLSKSMELRGGAVVGTILNNLALEKALNADGIKLLRTPVGDKYIADEMFKSGYSLGGEQSGHYIIRECGATGDGIAAGLFFIKSMLCGGRLKPPVRLDLCPQGAIAEYAKPSIMEDEGFKALCKKYQAEFSGIGRIVARMSGTEPKVRVMVECGDAEKVKNTLAVFKTYINSIQ